MFSSLIIGQNRGSLRMPKNSVDSQRFWAAGPAARRNNAAAAIFYSPACYRARIVAMKDTGYHNAPDEQNNLLASLSGALCDLRIGARFIAYEQVARGELEPRTTKVLFLWGALAR